MDTYLPTYLLTDDKIIINTSDLRRKEEGFELENPFLSFFLSFFWVTNLDHPDQGLGWVEISKNSNLLTYFD